MFFSGKPSFTDHARVFTPFLNAVRIGFAQAALKYPTFSWENDPSLRTSSTIKCQIDAMVRHMLICMLHNTADGCEDPTDEESGLLHIVHLATRAQILSGRFYRNIIEQEPDTPRNHINISSVEKARQYQYQFIQGAPNYVCPEVFVSILKWDKQNNDHPPMFQCSTSIQAAELKGMLYDSVLNRLLSIAECGVSNEWICSLKSTNCCTEVYPVDWILWEIAWLCRIIVNNKT